MMLKSPSLMAILTISLMVLMLGSCSNDEEKSQTSSISEAEIITFQRGLGTAFNAISVASNDLQKSEAADALLQKYYGFDDGKVMFNSNIYGNMKAISTYEAMKSYLIGGNTSFPEHSGFGNANWVYKNSKNDGIMNDQSIAIAFGQRFYENEEGDRLIENYSMCIKKNKAGELKLIGHKTSKACD